MRIRTVKPEFWTDAVMTQMPLMARLLFIGLWNCSDDHGFIEDEIDRISMQILPREDPVEVTEAFELLIASGRVDRLYGPDGSTFLQIVNWKKHQRVDHPAESKIAKDGFKKVAVPTEERRRIAMKYGCRPGEHKSASCFFCGSTGTIFWTRTSKNKPSAWVVFGDLEISHIEAESLGGENKAENLVLACRHCNRSTGTKHGVEVLLAKTREDSRRLALEGKGMEQGVEQGKEQGARAVDRLREIWNTQKAPEQPEWKKPKGKDAREKPANARWPEHSEEEWVAIVQRVAASVFCKGTNDRGWRATPDWLLRPGTSIKILEGAYDNRATPNTRAPVAAESTDWTKVQTGELDL